jgi:hypothetical protein
MNQIKVHQLETTLYIGNLPADTAQTNNHNTT